MNRLNDKLEGTEIAFLILAVVFVFVLCAICVSGCGSPQYQASGMLSGEWTEYQWQQRIGNDPSPPPALVGDNSIDDNTRWKLQHAVW